MKRSLAAVLFDLDGTLLDSAPDLAGTANDMRSERGLAALPYERLRVHASSGARGMLGAAFDLRPEAAQYEAMRAEFIARYEQRMLQTTRVFDAVLPMLEVLEARGLAWGIVTNKALRLAAPMVRAFGLEARAGVLIGGDSTPHTKPHPAPLLEAARGLALAPERCAYVGDDARDIAAGRAAGMATVVAGWGYLGEAARPEAWGADAVIEAPHQLLFCLDLA